MSHNTYCYKCGGNCAWYCGNCNSQPTNTSNKTEVIPVAGADNYQLWLSYNPDLDPSLNPDSPWTEPYWLDNWVKVNLNYEDFQI